MNCHELDAILDGHAIRTLSAAERARVDAHLAGCGRCAAAWFAEDQLLAEPSSVPEAALLARTVSHAVNAGRSGEPLLPRRARLPFWLAAAAAVVAVGASIWMLASERAGLAPIGSPAIATDAGPLPDLLPRPLAGPLLEDTQADEQGLAADTPSRRDAPDPGLVPRFVLGRHYVRLPSVADLPIADGRIEVIEFFMWPCFPCYAFEPSFTAWTATRPANVDIVRVPVLFNPLARLHAQAYYTAEALGLADTIRSAFFMEFHERENRLDNEAALADFFAGFGIDRAQFATVFESAPVQASLREAEVLAERFGINATPSIVVNGRYLSTPPMAGSYEALVEVVDGLVALERACFEDSECPLDRPTGAASLDELLRRVESGQAPDRPVPDPNSGRR